MIIHRLKSIERDGKYWLITFDREDRPNWFLKLLGHKTGNSVEQYHGQCTVFHNVETGARPGTFMESYLSEIVWKAKYAEKQKAKHGL